MFKKINNYHLFLLIIIVFILNTILFRSIDITKAQWKAPSGAPGQETSNIVTSPLSADLDLGDQSIIGEGNINIDGSGWFGGPVSIETSSSPTYSLEIRKQGAPWLGLTSTYHLVDNTVDVANIVFSGNSSFISEGQSVGAEIRVEGDGNGWGRTDNSINDSPSQMHFFTQSAGPINDLVNPRMTIDKDGNVGIGTDSPARPLTVETTDSRPILAHRNTVAPASNQAATIQLHRKETAGAIESMLSVGSVLFTAEDTAEAGAYSYYGQINALAELSTKKSQIRFQTNSGTGLADVMTIGPSGNVGIGITFPNKNLHIYDLTDGTNAEIDLQSDGVPGDGNHWGIYHDRSSDDLRFWREDDKVSISSNGNINLLSTDRATGWDNTYPSNSLTFQASNWDTDGDKPENTDTYKSTNKFFIRARGLNCDAGECDGLVTDWAPSAFQILQDYEYGNVDQGSEDEIENEEELLFEIKDDYGFNNNSATFFTELNVKADLKVEGSAYRTQFSRTDVEVAFGGWCVMQGQDAFVTIGSPSETCADACSGIDSGSCVDGITHYYPEPGYTTTYKYGDECTDTGSGSCEDSGCRKLCCCSGHAGAAGSLWREMTE